MSDRVVSLQVRFAYGQMRVYPVNETARLFARLIGTKTLSAGDLLVIEALGYRLEYVPMSMSLKPEPGEETHE